MEKKLISGMLTEFFNEDDDSEDSDSSSDGSSGDELFFMYYYHQPKQSRNSIKNYFEEVVPLYSQSEFRKHFRIGRNVFNILAKQFEQSEEYQKMKLHYNVTSPEKHLSVFLWYAGHEACSLRDIEDRFNLSIWTVHFIIKRVTIFLSNLSPKVIQWPNDDEQKTTSEYYRIRKGFPGIIGIVDGTHIQMDPPKRNPNDYIDRKGITSICLQGTCNENKKFIDIFVGLPGSVHDSRMLKNSNVFFKIMNIPEGYYLVGDSAYPCLKQLMVPYKDNGHLNQAKKKFNRILSSCRVDIEHTFGILKQRFRQLYYCKIRDIKLLCHFIRACCVLHNLSDIMEDIELFDLDAINPEDETDNYHFTVDDENGKELRDDLCNRLFS